MLWLTVALHQFLSKRFRHFICRTFDTYGIDFLLMGTEGELLGVVVPHGSGFCTCLHSHTHTHYNRQLCGSEQTRSVEARETPSLSGSVVDETVGPREPDVEKKVPTYVLQAVRLCCVVPVNRFYAGVLSRTTEMERQRASREDIYMFCLFVLV